MPPLSRPATLHDVARVAGVSYQTVSRVINGHPYVAVETLERVNAAIKELDYRPNRAARSLITGYSGIIQIVAFDTGNMAGLHALMACVQENGYHVAVTSLIEKHSLSELRAILDEVSSRRVDGILLSMPWNEITYDELKRFTHGIPFVVIGANMGPQTNSVWIDQAAGTHLAMQHLFELGHRRFAEISGEVDVYFDARIRHETCVKFLSGMGLPPAFSAGGNFTLQGGYQAALQLVQNTPTFTALFCANDETALGAMRALQERGIRIPQDVSVVGFDDLAFAAYCQPPLTTVRQDFRALGRQGMQRLLSLIHDPSTPDYQSLLSPELVIRASSAPILP